MAEKARWRTRYNHAMIAAGIGGVLLATGGCVGEAPKSTQTVTQDQVRSNADKTFEKLKQEEKNRTVGSGAAPY